MSQENVVLFTKTANEKPKLNERLSNTENLADWVRIAKEEGFEFTGDEFCSVIEGTLKKKVTPQDAVRQYLAAGKEMGGAELSEKALESVVGGVKTKYISFEPLFIQVKKPPTRAL